MNKMRYFLLQCCILSNAVGCGNRPYQGWSIGSKSYTHTYEGVTKMRNTLEGYLGCKLIQ